MSLQRVLNPGFVPLLKARLMSLPLPDTAKRILDHPAGPLTIHFWAPSFKWAISIANLSEISRPAELLSPGQQTAVAATGIIWCRYSMVIVPVNWNLFSVNVAMAVTGSYQLYRIISKRFFDAPGDAAAAAPEGLNTPAPVNSNNNVATEAATAATDKTKQLQR
eukprot:GHVS01056167.1.p1 GENE.GHVS01056167.1~~GHVS01056167.1.p1  ORF type:complete len:164 (+),score=26.33 GHVS01056167.1:252-743(+)